MTDIIGDVLQISASLETYSEHSLAEAIVKKYEGKLFAVSDFRAIPGQGITGVINDKTYFLVNQNMKLIMTWKVQAKPSWNCLVMTKSWGQ